MDIQLRNKTTLPKESTDEIFARIQKVRENYPGHFAILELADLADGRRPTITKPIINQMLFEGGLITNDDPYTTTTREHITDSATRNVAASCVMYRGGTYVPAHPYESGPQ